MKHKVYFGFRTFMVLIVLVIAGLSYTYLPEMVPAHWNLNGEVDRYADKGFGSFLFPLIILGTYLLFPLLPKIDPRKANYKDFEVAWEGLQTVLILFLSAFYFITLFITFRPDYNHLMGSLMMSAIGLMFMLMGPLIKDVQPNFFVGFRAPWTLEDPVVWKKVHYLSSKLMIVSGFLFLLVGLIPEYIFPLLILAILLLTIVPLVYSYWLYKKRHS